MHVITLENYTSLYEHSGLLELADNDMQEVKESVDFLVNSSEQLGVHLPNTGEIIIFGHKLNTRREAERTYFHESVHSALLDLSRKDAQSICKKFWDNMQKHFPEDVAMLQADKRYKEGEQQEELFCYKMEQALELGNFLHVDMCLDDKGQHILEQILNYLNFDKERERRSRKASRRAIRGNSKTITKNSITSKNEHIIQNGARTFGNNREVEWEESGRRLTPEGNPSGTGPREDVLYREGEDWRDGDVLPVSYRYGNDGGWVIGDVTEPHAELQDALESWRKKHPDWVGWLTENADNLQLRIMDRSYWSKGILCNRG